MKYLDLKKVNEPYVHAADEVLQSGWYLKGEATHRFEEHYAKYIGTEFCVGCANGLDALTLIFRAYKEMGVMHDGDEIIVPANTYIASILSVTENNLVPVLVEPDVNTLQIDDGLIEQAITPRTRAIMIVHLCGRCAYTDRRGEICAKYGLKLIEDNAQVLRWVRRALLVMLPVIAFIRQRTLEPLVMLVPSPPTMPNWPRLSVALLTMALLASMYSTILVVIAESMNYRRLSLMLSYSILMHQINVENR